VRAPCTLCKRHLLTFHVENYLLSDAEETGRGLTNGWTDTDSDTVDVLGQNDVVTDLTTSDVHVPRVLGTLEHTTDVNDTSGQTVQVSSHANDDVPTKLTATREIAHDTAVDETSMSTWNFSTHRTDSTDSSCFSFFSGMSVLTLALFARLSWLLVSF